MAATFMLDIAALVAGLVLVTMPGVCFWTALFPEHTFLERWIWGASAGLAMAVITAYSLAYLRLSLFSPAWAIIAAIALAVRWKRKPTAADTAFAAPERWLVLVLALVAISRFAPTLLQAIPPGWDPSFHSLLAKKVHLSDRLIHDWTPFEDIALNYPLGSHLLIVVLSRWTSLPLHRVFQLLIPALGVLSTAQIYGLAQRFFRSAEVALYSALAYGTWAFAGSIAYYNWGGLPNELGMVFLLPVLAMIGGDEVDRRSSAAIALFVAAIFLAHHHVALVAGLTLATSLGYLLLTSAKAGPSAPRKLPGILLGIAGGLLLGSIHLVPELLKAASLANTDALRLDPPNSTLLMMASMGVFLLAGGTCGLVLACGRQARARAGMLVAISLVLVAAYVICSPISAAYSLHRWGEERFLLAPSRFLVDLVYLLSVFAGYALWRVATACRLSLRGAAAAGLLLALANIPMWRDTFSSPWKTEGWDAYAWIEQHTPPETIVLNTDQWAPYVAWRATPKTPLPASEPRVRETAARRAAAAIALGRAPEAASLVAAIPPHARSRGCVVWTSPSGWSVVRLSPLPCGPAAPKG